MMRQEGLPSLKVGGKTLFRRGDVEAWLQAHTRQAPIESDTALDNQGPRAAASVQVTADEEHSTERLRRQELSPERHAQVSAMLVTHGFVLHTEPVVEPDIKFTGQDAEGHEITVVIELKAVSGENPSDAQVQLYRNLLSRHSRAGSSGAYYP
jgi:hypothetical protein